MKATITKAEYLQIVGLLVLATQNRLRMEQVEAALRELTGESAELGMGHCGDAVYDGGRCDADALLKRLNITVE